MLSISEYRISSAFVFADNTLSVDVLLRADVRANNRGANDVILKFIQKYSVDIMATELIKVEL